MNCPRCGTKMKDGICPECGFPVNQIRACEVKQKRLLYLNCRPAERSPGMK